MRLPYHIMLGLVGVLAIGGTARGFAVATREDPDGRKLYLKNCRQCHGATGEPSSETKHKYKKIKALNDAAFMASIPDDSILAVMKHGAGKDMKSFNDRLNHEEMEAVLKYIRTLPSKKSK
jgi:mono/diheme cytochrome c family protein